VLHPLHQCHISAAVAEALIALGNRVLQSGHCQQGKRSPDDKCLAIGTGHSRAGILDFPNPANLLESVPVNCYPIVLKPLNLPKQPHAIIENREMLRHHLSSSRLLGSNTEALHFAQRYTHLHEYTKIYVCAPHVAAYRKFIPFRTPECQTTTEELQRLAARVADC